LDYLFPDPPDENYVNADYDLKVDPTWGGLEPDENLLLDKDPDEAPFGFIVMTSPPAIQQSLDRRDGSHWDVFDCLDATTIGENSVRMTCTNMGEDSNCDNIHLGHGAASTIVQMPKGCGPGKYAVVKYMHPSTN
jgi:chitinase